MPKRTIPIYERPAELLQNLIRFDTTNPPADERVPVDALDFGVKAIFKAMQRFQ
jgi:hypothetical protein